YLYVPEFHAYAGAGLEAVLRDAAAHRLNLTLVDESLGQLSADARRAVFGTAGSIVALQSSGDEAVQLHRQMHVRRPARASTRARILERPRWRDLLERAHANGESMYVARVAHFDRRPPRPGHGRRNGRVLQRHGR